MENAFDPELIRAIFKLVWSRRTLERERNEVPENLDGEYVIVIGCAYVNPNANAMKLSSELLKLFITEAVQRAATIAEAEGVYKIEATHLERILPQLLLDF